MKRIFFGIIALCLTSAFASYSVTDQTRTFSCNGMYDGNGADFPMVALSSETIYTEAKETKVIELFGEDSKFYMTGSLHIKNELEFLKVRIQLKESGLVIFNHNSQLGQPAKGNFNFVGVWLEELGPIMVNGKQLFPKSASFQCQSYRN